MDHVGVPERAVLDDAYRPARGDVQLVGGGELRVGVGVTVLPPELVPDDRDVEGMVLRHAGQLEDRGDRGDGEHEQDQRGGDGPAPLEPGVPVHLHGLPLVVTIAPPEAHDGDDHEALDEHEDDHGDPEHELIEAELLGEVRLVVGCRR